MPKNNQTKHQDASNGANSADSAYQSADLADQDSASGPMTDSTSWHSANGAAGSASQNAQITAKLAELTNDLQRTRADFENYRKQVELQKASAVKSAELATVYKLLPLLDDLDRAIAAYTELAPLAKSLEKTLAGLKLTKIPSAPGTEFNPDLHDAVMVEGDGTDEAIAETLRPGYYYNSDVLRPAMVKVQKS